FIVVIVCQHQQHTVRAEIVHLVPNHPLNHEPLTRLVQNDFFSLSSVIENKAATAAQTDSHLTKLLVGVQAPDHTWLGRKYIKHPLQFELHVPRGLYCNQRTSGVSHHL